jgi:hypothetical protein
MEALGTVYLTYRDIAVEGKSKDEFQVRKNAIVGVDFRPTAGTDPKKVTAVVKELATLPDLETVLLLGKDVTDDAVNAIPATAQLTSIQFFNTAISDLGIAKLTRFKYLRVFKYTGMILTDEGMKSLGKIRTLHTVMITDAPITDVGVLALQDLTSLRTLSIENSNATERSIQRLRLLLGQSFDVERIFG